MIIDLSFKPGAYEHGMCNFRNTHYQSLLLSIKKNVVPFETQNIAR